MAKWFKLTIFLILIAFASSCGQASRPVPVNPFQKALDRIPAKIMGLKLRPLRIRGFVFNNIKETALSRRLPTWPLLAENELKQWLLGMGHNIPSSTDSAVDLGVWRHSEMLNPSTWSYNCFDITRDHEVIATSANINDFETWMVRHNFDVVEKEPALYLKQDGFHRDAVVFGSGVVVGPDGVMFICREVPTDGSLLWAYGLYNDEESLLSIPEITEITSKLPTDLYTGLVLKLDMSVSDYNQQTVKDETGMLGQPLTLEQTSEALELGRPKTLKWLGIAHAKVDGKQGLKFELFYENETEAAKDSGNLSNAIKYCQGRFTKKNWWKDDLHLGSPTITTKGKFTTLWAPFLINDETKKKLETLNMTKEEKTELWFEVRALFDFLDKLDRRDYGPFWQGY